MSTQPWPNQPNPALYITPAPLSSKQRSSTQKAKEYNEIRRSQASSQASSKASSPAPSQQPTPQRPPNVNSTKPDLGIWDWETLTGNGSKDIYVFGDVEGAHISGINGLDYVTSLQASGPSSINAKTSTLIMLGDLVDMSKYDIRWLQEFYNNPNMKCLIGNRDMNKVRLRDECLFVKFNETELPWQGFNGTFDDLCDDIANNFTSKYKFVFNGTDDELIKRYTTKDKPNTIFYSYNEPTVHWKVKTDGKTIDGKTIYTDSTPGGWDKGFTSDLNRIAYLYESTYNAGSVIDNRTRELAEMGIMQDLKCAVRANKNFKLAALALSNMLMCFNWPASSFEGITNLPLKNALLSLNGLYAKFMEKACIMAVLEKGTDCFIFTHTGFPPWISTKLGYAPKSGIQSQNQSQVGLEDVIKAVNEEKNKFVKDYFSTSETSVSQILDHIKTTCNNNTLIRYVQLSASTGVKEYDNYKAGAPYATMYGHVLNDITEHPYFSSQEGGFWPGSTFNTFDLRQYAVADANKEKKFYNIFGHQPQGFFPIALEKGNVTHICLDISMINRKSHLETGAYACMHLSKSAINMQGKFFLTRNPGYAINYNKGILSTIQSDITKLENNAKIEKNVEKQGKIGNNINELKQLLDKIEKHLNKVFIDDIADNEPITYNAPLPNFVNNFDELVKEKNDTLFKVYLYNRQKNIELSIGDKVMKCDCTFMFLNYKYMPWFMIATSQSPAGGKSKKRTPKRTSERINVNGRDMVVYQGMRGGKYIKRKNKFVSLKQL